jgi:folate-dependent phosphoribosylglycinamide formyltransferase PurN
MMRIGLLTARDAPGVQELLDDPHRGELYEVACIVSCDTVVPATEPWDVPVVHRGLPLRNLRLREHYDRHAAETLLSFGVDTVFVSGYPYVLTEPMLEAFAGRIVVAHDGDLTVRDDSGQRRWVGPHAVLDAIVAGEPATRNSLYFATADVGHGPLFLVSERFAVAPLVRDAVATGAYDMVEAYARLHRRWMRQWWGALLRRSIEFLTAGVVQVVGDTVWIDGAPAPCRLGEAPDLCNERSEPAQRGIPASCPFIQP